MWPSAADGTGTAQRASQELPTNLVVVEFPRLTITPSGPKFNNKQTLGQLDRERVYDMVQTLLCLRCCQELLLSSSDRVHWQQKQNTNFVLIIGKGSLSSACSIALYVDEVRPFILYLIE